MEQAVKLQSYDYALTDKGALTNKTTYNELLDLFFVIGSAQVGQSFSSQFTKLHDDQPENLARVMFWSRDVRGGQGRRCGFQDYLGFLAHNDLEVFKKIIAIVPEYGYWRDLVPFIAGEYSEEARFAVKNLIAGALLDNNALCAKWMPRKGRAFYAMQEHLRMYKPQYRKLLVNLTNVVETQMCAKDWDKIDYNAVPSVAAARYKSAFRKNGGKKYQDYLESLETGEEMDNGKVAKINASAIYPHDIIRSIITTMGNDVSAQAQWDALPDFVNGRNIFPIVDTSGSMTTIRDPNSSVSGWMIAAGLGLYVAERNSLAFRDQLMVFSSDTTVHDLSGKSLQSKVAYMRKNCHVGSTNLVGAFRYILDSAIENDLEQKDLPETLLVLSDMQFDQATTGNDKPAFDDIKEQFESHGYKLPDIVFWNLASTTETNPITVNSIGATLVSGYSPTLLKGVIGGDISPFSVIVKEVIGNDRYDPVQKLVSDCSKTS